MEEALQASIERVSLIVKSELTRLHTCQPVAVPLNTITVDHGVAEVIRTYHQAALSVLGQQHGNGASPPGRPEARSAAPGWERQLNGVGELPTPDSTPPARTLSNTSSHVSQTAALPGDAALKDLLGPSDPVTADTYGNHSPDRYMDSARQPLSSQDSRLTDATARTSSAASSQLRNISKPVVGDLLRAQVQLHADASTRLQQTEQQLLQQAQAEVGGAGWGSRSSLQAFVAAQEGRTNMSTQQSGASSSDDVGSNDNASRFVLPGANPSPALLKNLHAALAAGNLPRQGDNSEALLAAANARNMAQQQQGAGNGLMVVGDQQQDLDRMSASLLAQHSMLLQAVQQQQQQQQTQQRQQFLLHPAHNEQVVLAHELQLDPLTQLAGNSMLQYQDSSAGINSQGNSQQIMYQVDPNTGSLVAVNISNRAQNDINGQFANSDGNLSLLGLLNNGGMISSTPASGQGVNLNQLSLHNNHISEPLPLLVGNNSTASLNGGLLGNGGVPDNLFLSNNLLSGMPQGTRLVSMGASGNLFTAPARPLLNAQSTAASMLAPASILDLPGRFKVLPASVQQRIINLCRTNPVITIRDFDDKVVSKLSLLVDSWGTDQALAMLEHLEHRMRSKQGAMKNGPGYLDVAVCSHLDMLKAQGACPKSMKLDEYAQQVLAPPVFHELCIAVNNNRWLAWEHFDQGIIQLVKRLPVDSAVEKLQEITYHSFKNVDNIKGCIMSILNSKIREDRRRQ